jgi:pilus assembly protein CpaE
MDSAQNNDARNAGGDQKSLLRILPACLTEPLPRGWDESPENYLIEVMPAVERPEVVALSIKTTEPDILLLDADFPDFDAAVIAREALDAREGLAVVMMSHNNAPDQLRRAMLAGVEEYLIKPLEGGALRESLVAIAANRNLRAVESAPDDATETAKGLVIGVVSGKGGLGKTTIATNLASLVAKVTRQPVGLIGFESGDGAIMLSLQPKLGLLDMAGSMGEDAAAYTPEWLSQFGVSHRSGLMYWTWQGTGTNASGEIPEDFLPNLFEVCRRAAPYTFIDFPLLSEDEVLTITPLLDVIIVVTSSSDLLALRSTKTFIDSIPEELRRRVRIVINRSDPNDMISREDFEEAIGRKVSAVLPNEPQVAAQAINMGAPFITTQTQSTLAIEVRELARRLFKVTMPENTTKTKRRFALFNSLIP